MYLSIVESREKKDLFKSFSYFEDLNMTKADPKSGSKTGGEGDPKTGTTPTDQVKKRKESVEGTQNSLAGQLTIAEMENVTTVFRNAFNNNVLMQIITAYFRHPAVFHLYMRWHH